MPSFLGSNLQALGMSASHEYVCLPEGLGPHQIISVNNVIYGEGKALGNMASLQALEGWEAKVSHGRSIISLC